MQSLFSSYVYDLVFYSHGYGIRISILTYIRTQFFLENEFSKPVLAYLVKSWQEVNYLKYVLES